MSAHWTPARFFRIVVVLLLATLIVAEVVLYFPPAQATITSSLELSRAANGTITGSFVVTSTYTSDLNLSATIGNGAHTPTTLYFYYDPAYPSSWSSPIWSFGLTQHVPAVMAGRGLHPSIVVLNAAELRGFLEDPSDAHSVLVMATGVIPDTVYNASENYLAPWIRGGGTLLWFGDTIGYYSGRPYTAVVYPSPLNPGIPGVSEFVNDSLFGSGDVLYYNASAASRAYDFTFDYGMSGHGLLIPLLESQGGIVLGEVAGNYTNAARLPLGNGVIDYFSVPMLHDITDLSDSLVNMLQSGVLTGPFQPVGLESLVAHGGASTSGSLTIDEPYLTWENSSTQVCLLLYQSDLLAIYGNSLCVPLALIQVSSSASTAPPSR